MDLASHYYRLYPRHPSHLLHLIERVLQHVVTEQLIHPAAWRWRHRESGWRAGLEGVLTKLHCKSVNWRNLCVSGVTVACLLVAFFAMAHKANPQRLNGSICVYDAAIPSLSITQPSPSWLDPRPSFPIQHPTIPSLAGPRPHLCSTAGM